MHEVYSSAEFEEQYTYTGDDLGALWTPGKTSFRVWAPTAQEVIVNLYRGGAADADDLLYQLHMRRDQAGTWTAERAGDLNGIYYTFLVMADGQLQEACDPYARAVGVNGQRAMVIDMAATDPEGWDRDKDPHAGAPITDAVIYELHIRDISAHRSGRIQNRGKYLGLAETGTKTKGGQPTGLDHIKDLGVTHVHLLPVFDFGYTDESRRTPMYNWGYDPVNFNVPEGSYASDPFHGAVRVRELKQLVKALHDNGLSVVLDVVYNHVYQTEQFCFNKIVPGYFSRSDGQGHLSNGSGCGNDTASERSMVRKYIIDSLLHWVEQYHVDGFRFDLVGLIDIDTINAAMAAVHRDHPNVIFYGEGWSLPTCPTKPGVELTVQTNSGKVPGFAFFSDTIRDQLRGSVFDTSLPGYVTGAMLSKDALEASFMGVPLWAAQPSQCVNYASCHDNNTLFDRIALAAPEAPMDVLIQMNSLAAAFTILAQGVPFFQAGEELLRSKPGKKGGFDHNSFRSGDKVNAIRWEHLDKEEYRRSVAYYRGLIAFRKAHEGLRLATRDQVWAQVHPVHIDNGRALAFRVEERVNELMVIFNADTQEVHVPLAPGPWEVYIRDGQAGTTPLGQEEGVVTVGPIRAMVLARRRTIDVVAALIWEKDKFLICQRSETASRALLWEFPGGKVEPGETPQQALARECAEELDITVEVRELFRQVVHEYPDMRIRLSLYHCVIPAGFPKLVEHIAMRWIHPCQAGDFPFCPADTKLAWEVRQVYEDRKPLDA